MKNLILKPEKETSVRKIELQNWNYPNNRKGGNEGGSGMFYKENWGWEFRVKKRGSEVMGWLNRERLEKKH